MKIGYLQLRTKFGEPEANRRRAASLLRSERFDLLVLPELCFSGYFMPSRDAAFELSEPFATGPSFDLVRELSHKGGGATVFGFPERDGDKVYNSAALVLPGGESFLYRKTHLFFREKEWFDPGDTGLRVFDCQGVRIGLMICFDWVFPEAMRKLMLDGADIVCHPSNLVLPYCQDAMVTRCLENRVYAVTANRIGTDRQGEDEFTFTGLSQITATKGEILSRAPAEDEAVAFAEIDPARARDKSVTALNNILTDRRPDLYG